METLRRFKKEALALAAAAGLAGATAEQAQAQQPETVTLDDCDTIEQFGGNDQEFTPPETYFRQPEVIFETFAPASNNGAIVPEMLDEEAGRAVRAVEQYQQEGDAFVTVYVVGVASGWGSEAYEDNAVLRNLDPRESHRYNARLALDRSAAAEDAVTEAWGGVDVDHSRVVVIPLQVEAGTELRVQMPDDVEIPDSVMAQLLNPYNGGTEARTRGAAIVVVRGLETSEANAALQRLEAQAWLEAHCDDKPDMSTSVDLGDQQTGSQIRFTVAGGVEAFKAIDIEENDILSGVPGDAFVEAGVVGEPIEGFVVGGGVRMVGHAETPYPELGYFNVDNDGRVTNPGTRGIGGWGRVGARLDDGVVEGQIGGQISTSTVRNSDTGNSALTRVTHNLYGGVRIPDTPVWIEGRAGFGHQTGPVVDFDRTVEGDPTQQDLIHAGVALRVELGGPVGRRNAEQENHESGVAYSVYEAPEGLTVAAPPVNLPVEFTPNGVRQLGGSIDNSN